MNKKHTPLALLALLFALLGFTACSKSVEGEQKSWESNQKAVKDLALSYPAFKSVLESQLEAAQQAMKAAEGIKDEKERIEKMAAANEMAFGEFARYLRNFDKEKKTLREKMDKLGAQTLDEANRANANRAIEEARMALQKAEAAISKGGTTLEDATSATRLAKKAIEEATESITRIEKLAQDKQKQTTEQQAQQQAQDSVKKVEEQKAQFITCQYCQVKNEAGSTKCKGCNAPLN
ncbi:hypothetical protein [Hugenholtzia roseola]|uniref:hypothetical protein n=1 Tax=Hugenholtzia roseola TaxID=1002 RepID=UPI0003FEA909|nr:hypothetical protein [Hugenholtzia roseola]